MAKPADQRLKEETASTNTYSVRLFFTAAIGVVVVVAVSVLAVLSDKDLVLPQHKILLAAVATGLQSASGAAVALLTLTVILNISITRVKRTFERVYNVVQHNPVIIDERTESGLTALLNGRIGDLQKQVDALEVAKKDLEATLMDLRRSQQQSQAELEAAERRLEQNKQVVAESARDASSVQGQLHRLSEKLKGIT